MDFEFSGLRIVGLLVSSVFLTVFFRRLRSYQPQRGLDWLIALSALTIGLIALMPGLASIPTEILKLDRVQGGRIITLLLLVTAITWILLLRLRTKYFVLNQQVAGLIHHQSIAFALEETTLIENSILILIPAYNEAENLPHVLPKIPKQIAQYPVIPVVIDDCSDDDTALTASALGAIVLSHPVNSGGGMALRTGYLFAKKVRPKVIVTMDADGQHLPEEIAQLIEPILNNQADVVIGSRRLGKHVKTPLFRKLGIYFFSSLISQLIHKKITDCSSGFRAFRSGIIHSLTLRQAQYHAAELIIEAGKRGFKITESPITIVPRISGVSKKGPDLLYGMNFFSSILRVWLR